MAAVVILLWQLLGNKYWFRSVSFFLYKATSTFPSFIVTKVSKNGIDVFISQSHLSSSVSFSRDVWLLVNCIVGLILLASFSKRCRLFVDPTNIKKKSSKNLLNSCMASILSILYFSDSFFIYLSIFAMNVSA